MPLGFGIFFLLDLRLVLFGRLGGFPLLIQQITGIRTFISKNPLDSVAVGIGRVIEAQSDDVSLSYRSR